MVVAASGANKAAGHAERMDAIYALQRHFYDLTRKYYLLGRDRLIEQLDVPAGGHVLEVGCGTARNLSLVATAWPDAHLYGVDISSEMLKSAKKNLQKHHFTAHQSLALADAASFDPQAVFGRKAFDRVFCSYTLSMIPAWEEALENCCSLLAPGGEVHVVDFGQQEQLPRWFRLTLRAWLARFHVEPCADLFTVSKRLADRFGLTCEARQLYRDYARYLVFSRP